MLAALLLHRLFHLAEFRRVGQVQADVAADQPQRRGEQERQAPAPFVQRLAVEVRVQLRGEQRAEQQPGGGARRHQAGVEAALVFRCVLGEEGRRAGVLTGGREALHQADHQQQRRGDQADLCIGGQQGDAEGRAGHDQDRQREGVAPAEAVADMAPDDAADGADDERQGEHREGGEQAGGLVGLREEHHGDDRGEVAVGGVVEPFDEVAHEGGGSGPAQDAAFLGDGGHGRLAIGHGLLGQAHCAPPRQRSARCACASV
ncbi:hypothetical protein D9M68_643910 [compost metagenome]